jgi:hypothetical protein
MNVNTVPIYIMINKHKKYFIPLLLTTITSLVRLQVYIQSKFLPPESHLISLNLSGSAIVIANCGSSQAEPGV